MKCISPGCKEEAVKGKNYCKEHQRAKLDEIMKRSRIRRRIRIKRDDKDEEKK